MQKLDLKLQTQKNNWSTSQHSLVRFLAVCECAKEFGTAPFLRFQGRHTGQPKRSKFCFFIYIMKMLLSVLRLDRHGFKLH